MNPNHPVRGSQGRARTTSMKACCPDAPKPDNTKSHMSNRRGDTRVPASHRQQHGVVFLILGTSSKEGFALHTYIPVPTCTQHTDGQSMVEALSSPSVELVDDMMRGCSNNLQPPERSIDDWVSYDVRTRNVFESLFLHAAFKLGLCGVAVPRRLIVHASLALLLLFLAWQILSEILTSSRQCWMHMLAFDRTSFS